MITYENGIYTVFDERRNEYAFVSFKEGVFVPLNKHSGILTRTTTGTFHWNDHEVETLMNAELSQLSNTPKTSASIKAAPQKFTKFTVESSTTSSVNSEQTSVKGQFNFGLQSFQHPKLKPGQRNHFECLPTPIDDPNDTPVDIEAVGDTLQMPLDTSSAESAEPPQDPVQEQDPEHCEAGSDEAHTFQNTLNIGVHTTLDARPASCQSYFVEYYGTDRGFEIEAGLQAYSPYNSYQSTLRTFPVIDFISDTDLYVVNSRDLGNQTFNSTTSPDALYEQLINDGEDIQNRFVDVLAEQGSITASELGQSTTISSDQIRPITLQLIIRDGIASASHWEQIARARRELMQRFGITLEVIVIP